MQIVIDTMQCPCRTLSDECCIIHNECYEGDICSSCPLIRNGGVKLPKGHGDLVDKSKIYKAIPAEEDNLTGQGMTLDEMDAYNEGIDAMYFLVKNTPTIIEADKEG